jgi:hypothetical protein
MLFYYFKTTQAIGTFMSAFLRKFNAISYLSYINGHFFLYWSFYWLIVRLLVKPWILSFSYFNQLSLQTNPIIFTIVFTIISIVIAFIPTLFTSISASLYGFLTKTHVNLLYQNPLWIAMVCSLIVLEAWVMFSKTRRIIALLIIFIQFAANFFSHNNNPFFLFGWLFILYTFMYHTRVVFHIFPDYPRTKNFKHIEDFSFYTSSLDAYYGVVRPIPVVNSGTKKNIREYHTTTKKLLPYDDLLNGNGSNSYNNNFLRKAAQFRVGVDSRNGKLFPVESLRTSQLGTLGGKEWIFTDPMSVNYSESIANRKSLGQNMSNHFKCGSKVTAYIPGLAAVGTLAACAFTAIGGTYLFMESYPQISNIVMKGLTSGQDLPAPEEVIKDDIDMYLESREIYKK